MITKKTVLKSLDIDIETLCVSISLQTIISEDGIELTRSPRHRKAFAPGNLEDVKAYTGMGDSDPQIKYLSTVWTSKVINDYKTGLDRLAI